MMRFRHCTVAAAILVVTASVASAQAAPQPAPATGESTLTIFVKGTAIGRMQSTVVRAGTSWVLRSIGLVGDVVLNRLEIKYDSDWQPTEMRLEASQAKQLLLVTTSFGLTTAVNEITQNGEKTSKTDQISPRPVVLPNNFYGAYEALAVRLAAAAPGAEIPVYVPPQGELKLVVKAVSQETMQTPAGTVSLRKFAVMMQQAETMVDATVAIDDRNRFARFELPSAMLSVVRSDLAGVSARLLTARNPTDADVTIPTSGFNLAATLTTPRGEGRRRHPTVVLVAGSGPSDRDETVAGIPVFAQLAGALAERGFMVVRYDKRGVGQSGGRTETVTLQDYADDVVAIIKWLSKRDDVDTRRLGVVGHSEGGLVAMLAAAREKKIDSLVLVATPGSTGGDLVLEQQRHQLDMLKLSDAERQQKIALQQQVHAAVISEKGWEAIQPDVRRQADTPWFRSVLKFDPARTMPGIKQPILVVQGDLDTEVPPHHAERLADMARKRKKSPPVETVHLPGVNHLLVKATTGEMQEYPLLGEQQVTPDAAAAIAEWLRR